MEKDHPINLGCNKRKRDSENELGEFKCKFVNCKNKKFSSHEQLNHHINSTHFVSEKDNPNSINNIQLVEEILDNNNNNNNEKNNNQIECNKQLEISPDYSPTLIDKNIILMPVCDIEEVKDTGRKRNINSNAENVNSNAEFKEETKKTTEKEFEREKTGKEDSSALYADEISTCINALLQSVTIIDELKNIIDNPLPSREQNLLIIRDKLFEFILLVKKLQFLNNQLNNQINENIVENESQESSKGHLKPLLINIYELKSQCTKYEEEIQHLTLKITELEKENLELICSFKKIQHLLRIDIVPFTANLRKQALDVENTKVQ